MLKLKEIAKTSSGATPLRARNDEYFVGGTIPWVKTMDLNNSLIKKTQETITEQALNQCSLRLLPKGSILIAMYGGFNQIGRTGLLTIEATTNQALCSLVLNEKKAYPLYVLYWLNYRREYWKRFAASSRKDPNITRNDVDSFPIELPSLPEQQKIAEILSTWDEAIAKTIKLVDFKKKQFKWLRTKLIENSTGAKDYTLEELIQKSFIKLGRGNIISKKDFEKYPGDFPVYSSSIKNDGTFGKYGKYMFDQELITWSIDGGGHFFYRGKHRFSVTNVCGYMTVDVSKIDYYFLATQLQLLREKLVFDYQIKAHPSVIKEIYQVKLPSLDYQKKTSEQLKSFEQEINFLEYLIQIYRTQKQGLMQKLLTGKVRVKV